MEEKVKVKILGVSCAHRKDMNTAFLVKEALNTAQRFGERIKERAIIETEFIDLADKKIRPCLNCTKRPDVPPPYKGTDRPEAGCIIKDDYLWEIWPKFKEADGYIFGAPTYTYSYTSKFALLFERFVHGIWQGYFSGKPAGAITTGYMPFGGQEICLQHMAARMAAVEMIPVHFGCGASTVSGPPYGPAPYEDEGVIGVKNDKMGRFFTSLVGRRVAEFAVLIKIAKETLGDLYYREFVQLYHPPHGDESWWWY